MYKRQTIKLVEDILMKYPHTRDSDKELIIGVLQALGANLSQEQRDLMRKVNFESIRRHRQKLQEKGLFQPSPEVAKRRRLKSYIVQQNAPTAKPEYLGELIEQQPEATVPKGIPFLDYEPYPKENT
jgi:hypothetical protein